jgi:hypothetical protein
VISRPTALNDVAERRPLRWRITRFRLVWGQRLLAEHRVDHQLVVFVVGLGGSLRPMLGHTSAKGQHIHRGGDHQRCAGMP